MGCYPLRVIVSKALGKCNGRERWMEDQRMDYAMAYPPGPHPETHYMRPVARTVTFSGTNSVHMIPPNPPPQQQQHPEPQPQAPPPQPQAPPPQHEPQPQPEQPAPAPEQGAPPPEQQPRQPKRGKKKPPRRVRFGPEPPPQQQQQEHQEQQQQQQQQPEHAPNSNPGNGAPEHHGQQGRGPPGYLRYTPSPLPRWEATPRRHEYFSGEYRYSYPTPVREGIYSMATDANRLTTIFSEENPNACAIV